MSTVATTIRIPASLQERYDQLARATGRTRNYLMAEALERYAAREGWQIEQTRATLAALEAGTLETIDLDDLIAEDLAAGELTQEDLDEAYTRYGVTS
ncbi:MAG TPA: ribbon-helix-helix protein, CopG family [Chloroflexota bacterium]|nr:ribbon-helix-helix protein, CopG family [Chloroflexota bacterium]